MAYHPLTNESGGDTDSRRSEATKIIQMIATYGSTDGLSQKEKEFLAQMEDEAATVSVKQLFWLRDILAKCD
jgi:hypothetical protein